MIALEGDFAYNFILGVMSAVNPCGFVLLPTYLIYYLGMELQPDATRASTLRRGLLVGSSVSSGFVGLFLIVGIITQSFTTVVRDNSKYLAFVVGLGLGQSQRLPRVVGLDVAQRVAGGVVDAEDAELDLGARGFLALEQDITARCIQLTRHRRNGRVA